MMKGVPYFCHSHLIALMTIGTTPQLAAPQFDDTKHPEEHMAKVLPQEELQKAYEMIRDVSTQSACL